MAMIGVVFYADDPERKVFRHVYLSPGDTVAEFHDPRHVTEGCDPSRQAMLILVDSDSPRAKMTGTP